MYSLNDITNGYVKIEPREDGSHCNGPSKQMIFTSKFPAVKEENPETSCSGVGQQTVLLPQTVTYQVASIEETDSQSDVLNIQITNVQGAPCIQNGSKDEVTGKHLESLVGELPTNDGENNEDDDVTQEKMPMAEEFHDEQHIITQENTYPVETEQPSIEQEKEMPRRLSHHPYVENSQASLSSFQMSSQYPLPDRYQLDGRMPAYQFGSSHQLPSNSTVPLYHVAVQDGLSTSQMGDNARYQAMNYHPEIPYHNGHNSHESLKAQLFHQNQDVGPQRRSSTSSCSCCCHSPSQSEYSFFPAFGVETQRPSVIMVPVSWSSTASGFSHVPLKVNSPYSHHSQSRRNVVDRMVQNDSDSSDDDEDGNREKYFRMNIDGTTARFKLTKEDWERIPINTFPSGGRLLSGDWTRIFLNKVKESNPWCSLRFKNNHVRSENSRKIHSAVFFRGGAECKRPECNVKVRFVIQKERGKYVDVTYVGDVCHSSEPGGSDFTSDKRRHKIRVRRTYSS